MKRWIGAAAILIVGALIATTSAQGPAPTPGPEYVPGELLVQYRPAATETRRDAILSARAARLMRRYRQLDMDRLQLAAGTDLNAAMAALRATPDVIGVSANYVRHIVQTPAPPNDPFWTSSQMWGLLKIQAQSVWTTLNATGNGSVVIMDIDTGVNYNHEDLAANIWTNPNETAGDGIDNDGDGYIDDIHGINAITGTGDPLDDEGHGTHTAGTLAAVGNNGVGVVGVNWNAKILACKFLDSTGSGSDGDAIECLNYAVTLKTLHNINIRVTNNSWGGRRLGGPVPTMLQAAFDAAGNAGILNVVAAGNNGFNIELAGNAFDPASLAATSPSIIAVASTGQSDTLSSFSNWGSHTVALAAPGEGIISTYFNPTHPANNTYASADGTSMATPHVAGTAALLSSMDPTLTVAQLEALLLGSHVDVVAGLGGKVISGGRLNAFKAASGLGPTNQPPTAVLTGPPNNATYTAPATVPMSATASDPDVGDTIDHVTFYANGNPIGNVTTPQAGVYNLSWMNVAAGSYTITAAATDNHGLTGSPSAGRQITVNPGGGGGVPPPWTAQDVGTVGAAGSASATGGVFTVQGAGDDIWNNADAFQFVWQSLTGDGQIVARVVSQQNTNAWAKAGVMLREGVTSGARQASLLVTPSSGLAFERRLTTNGSSTYSAGSGTAPVWLKVVRAGTTVSVYQSPDGTTWTLVGSDTLAGLASTVQVGLAVTSHVLGTVGTVVFDNVTVTANGSNQAPTAVLTGPPNNATYTAPATVPMSATASDPDVGDTIDHVTFYANGNPIGNVTTPQAGVYNLSWMNVAAGSYTITATATDNHGSTGVPSAGRQITVNPGGGNQPPTAVLTGPPNNATYTAPATVPMSATASDPDPGDTIDHVTFYANGNPIGNVTTPQAGVYNLSWMNVVAGSYTITATATDNHGLTGSPSAGRQITVNPGGGGGVPPPWTAQDVGTVGAAGSASATGGVFTVQGAGDDIWNNADAFQFVWQSLTGDGQIVARVVSQQNTNAWAKAGVMLREGVTSGARQASLLVTPSSGLAFERRLTTNGSSTYSAGSGTAPVWLKVVRAGTTVSVYQSPDGTTWTLVGSDTLAGLASTVQVGLAVTSHVLGTVGTVVFDNVTVTANGSNQAPTAVLTGPPNNATYTAPATVPMSATASDPDVGDTIDHVTFYANGNPIGNVTTPQAGVYNLSWMNVAAGSYTITAAATDNHGLTGSPSAGRQITVNPGGGGGVPPPWTAQDVGTVGAAGSASATGGVFTVQGAGDDIWNNADAFQFVWQSLTGDGQIVARVVSQQNTNAWAKAGVMLREGVTSGARQASLLVTPSSGLAFERRLTTNGSSTYSAGSGTAPVWLKLVRAGTTVSVYQSPDGTTWTLVGSDTLAGLASTVQVGLAVTSHALGTLGTVVFDNVTVGPGS